MKTIGDLSVGEGALVDIRAISLDPDWQCRISLLYDALPLKPLPTGIAIAYVEKIRRNKDVIFKVFYPKVEKMKDIPIWEWVLIYQMNSAKISVLNWLEPTLFRKLHESMPEFPCRICNAREIEKFDVCFQCNKFLSYYMGKCLDKYPNIGTMKIREQIIIKLKKIKINEPIKNIRP